MILDRMRLGISSAVLLLLASSGAVQAQCTGWPVSCVPMHPGVGGGGMGMGAASAAFDIGITLFSMMLQQQQQTDTTAVAPQSTMTTGSYSATPALGAPAPAPPAPSPLTLQEKSSLLNQIRPLSTRGSYAATSPASPATTSALEADKAALLGQMRPLGSASATGTGGSGVGPSAAPAAPGQKVVASQSQPANNAKLNGPDENASANARTPFDTAGNQTPRSAADQLCQAAGRANGCIGSFTGSSGPRATNVTADGAVKLPIASTVPGVVSLPSTRRICGADVVLDQPQFVTGADPLRAGGFPIGHTPDELRVLDYSDIKANLAAMTPLQLAKMRLAAQQQAALAAVAIDGLRTKLFQAGLAGATPIPVEKWPDAAKAAMIEAAKDAVPFWRSAEELARKEAAEDAAAKLKTLKEYVDQGGEIDDKREELMKFLDKSSGVEEHEPKSNLPGTKQLSLSYFDSLVHGMLAVDAAQKGHWGDASTHAANAVQDLRPMADLVLSEDALLTLGRAEGPLGAALFSVDAYAKYKNSALEKQELLDKKAKGQELSLALATRLDALKGKQRDLENLLRMMAEEPRCAR